MIRSSAMPQTHPFTLFIFLGCLFLLTSAGDFYSSDGEVMYQATGALVDRGSLALTPNPGLPQIVLAVNGDWVSKYEPGMTLVGVVFYKSGAWIAHWLGADRAAWTRLAVALLPGVCMALAVTALYSIAARLDQRRALAVALIAGLATPTWPYSRVLFPEALLAALLTLSVASALHHTGRSAWWGGAFLGMAVATRAVNILHGIPLLLLQIHTARQPKRQAAIFLLSLVPWVGLVLAHNMLRFGSPLVFGYTGEGFTTPPLEGAFGLLLSSGKGLFWYAPPLLVSVLLWPRLRRDASPLAWALLGMGSLAAATYGAWTIWHGGWCWGPRYLVPLVPLWMLPLVRLPHSRRWSAALAAALIAGAALQWAAVRANSNDYYAAMQVDTDPAALHRVLYDPAASPILAQWALVLRGQTVPLAMADLAGRGLPLPWNIAVPGLLVTGLVGGAWRLAQALRRATVSPDREFVARRGRVRI